MILELRALIEGEAIPFTDALDLSALDFSGRYLFPEPVRLTGAVQKRTGIIQLDGRYETTMSMQCDRCGKPFGRALSEPLIVTLAKQREAEDREDIVLLRNDACDLHEIFEPAVILSVPSKILCSEDCAGLCPRCGHDLNESSCDCAPEADPRWDALRALIDE